VELQRRWRLYSSCIRRIFRGFTLRTFACATLDGVARTGRLIMTRLRRSLPRTTHDGCPPGYQAILLSAHGTSDASAAAWPLRRPSCEGHEQTRLALVALRYDGGDRRLRGRRGCDHLGHCTPACAQGAKASTDITYWRSRCAPGRAAHALRVREITTNEHGMATGVVYTTRMASSNFSSPKSSWSPARIGTPRLLLNSPPVAFRMGLQISSGLVGKKTDVPSLRSTLWLCGRADRQQPCAADLPVSKQFLRDRSLTRLVRAMRSSSAVASGLWWKPS